ncbi:hypothetical protein ACHAXA_007929 [Cyclostephanos tholiformis]|uniref:Pentatricopeptide repeat-containing protein n=1 Tax=Cyclostephanos tholiformis TaxID=382380 RepID=A0ABD3R8Y9_9STRA
MPIHMSLVETHARTGDVHLAPSTISYNAAINAWSKSYHPSAGEMAELLLGEMMHEWKYGNDGRGNERVKPDVVTFTAPGMRPNCYTYSAVMNALAKSCCSSSPTPESLASSSSSSLPTQRRERVVGAVGRGQQKRRQEQEKRYDPAREAQEMLEDMIIKHRRYRERVGMGGRGMSRSSTGVGYYGGTARFEKGEELTFPPNTINYNSVLNAWSRASSSSSAHDAGGNYIGKGARTWESGRQHDISKRKVAEFSDLDRIERAMTILDRLEAWARRDALHHRRRTSRKWRTGGGTGAYENKDDDIDDKTEAVIVDDEIELDDDIDDKDLTIDRKDLFDLNDATLEDGGVNVMDDENRKVSIDYGHQTASSPSWAPFRQHDKARDLDVEVYNSILVAYSREKQSNVDHAATVMRLLDRMENLALELDMPSVRPNQRSYNIALSVITNSAARLDTSLAGYYIDKENDKRHEDDEKRGDSISSESGVAKVTKKKKSRLFNPLGCDNQYSAGAGIVNPGERCSEILRHMQQRHLDGFPRVKPNIRTYNAVIDSFAYNGRLEEAESMLFSMVDNFESSAMRSMLEGIEDTELPVRPDSFSFNTVIQQWARCRNPDGGRRAELVLDRMLEFHHNGNADVRPDERSFAYIIYHYTKGAGRMEAKAPDRALKLLRRMIKMYREGYKELLPSYQNKTNPIFAFTSVIDAHSVLRRPDSGIVGDELFNSMMLLGENIDALSPNTYACLSVFYAWSSCGSVDAGERATELLSRMEYDMIEAAKRGEESRMRTTQRCYILAQTAWARSPSERKAEGAFEVLEMMQKNYASGNKDARPTVQAYSMVLNSCAFADTFQDENGILVKASPENQLKAFRVAEMALDRISKKPYPNVIPNPVIFGTFIKCCGRLDLPDALVVQSATRAFRDCCRAGCVSDFVLTQLRCALSPEKFLNVLVKNGYQNLDTKGKSMSRDGKRLKHIGISELPQDWTRNVDITHYRSHKGGQQ